MRTFDWFRHNPERLDGNDGGGGSGEGTPGPKPPATSPTNPPAQPPPKTEPGGTGNPVDSVINALNNAQQQSAMSAQQITSLQEQVAKLEGQNAELSTKLAEAEEAQKKAAHETRVRDVAAALGKFNGESAPPVDNRLAELALTELGDKVSDAEALKIWRNDPKQAGLGLAAGKPSRGGNQPPVGSAERGGEDRPESVAEMLLRLSKDESLSLAQRQLYARQAQINGGPGLMYTAPRGDSSRGN